MELTKFEKRLLDDGHIRRVRGVLWLGVACLIGSLGILAIKDSIVNRLQAPYQAMIDDLYQIRAETTNEAKLKAMLVEVADGAKLGWAVAAESTVDILFLVLGFLGASMVGTYSWRIRVHRLLKKLEVNS